MNQSDDFGPPVYLAELFYATFLRWRIIAGTAVVCLLVSIAYVFLIAPNLYTARALVIPVNERNAHSPLNDALSMLPFAKIGGLISSSTPATETNIALETIYTQTFFKKLLQKHPPLRNLVLPDCAFGSAAPADARLCGPEELWKAWNRWQKSILRTGTKEETGLLWIEITLPDPQLAAEVTNSLIEEVDQQIREQRLEQTAANIRYLSNQLEAISQTEVRLTIADLLKQQVEQHMLASNDAAYIFRVLEEAVPPVFRSSPRPLLIALAATFLGLLLGTFIAFAKSCRDTFERQPATLANNASVSGS